MSDAGGQADAVDDAVGALARVVAELQASGSLAGTGRDQSGIEKELLAMAEEFETRTGIVTVVDVNVDDDLVGRLRPRAEDVAELVRQALADVRRRAGVRTCQIELFGAPEGAALCVGDDGPIADLPGDPRSVLADVAARVGAGCDVVHNPGRGTVVRFLLPET